MLQKNRSPPRGEVELLTYLQDCEPEELVRFSGQTYRTHTHDSLKISNGKGIGGPRELGERRLWIISLRSGGCLYRRQW